MQYREYVRRLERLGQDLANKDLSDIDPLELFLKPEDQNLYQDIRGGYVQGCIFFRNSPPRGGGKRIKGR